MIVATMDPKLAVNGHQPGATFRTILQLRGREGKAIERRSKLG
jgi:hypothetical protein